MSETSRTVQTGRCICGGVHYECGPALTTPTLCHCLSCRRSSGAHALGWITVASASVVFTQGSPRVFRSSPDVQRTFCGNCGTPLTYHREGRAEELDITIGSLDSPELFPPVDHIWMSDAVSWDRPRDGLPQYVGSRDGA